MSTITQDQERGALERVPTQLFIGGEWRDASGGATLDVEDPSTGETIASVADATPDDASAALDAACGVQAEWAAHPPRGRGGRGGPPPRRARAARSGAAPTRRSPPRRTSSRSS